MLFQFFVKNCNQRVIVRHTLRVLSCFKLFWNYHVCALSNLQHELTLNFFQRLKFENNLD